MYWIKRENNNDIKRVSSILIGSETENIIGSESINHQIYVHEKTQE